MYSSPSSDALQRAVHGAALCGAVRRHPPFIMNLPKSARFSTLFVEWTLPCIKPVELPVPAAGRQGKGPFRSR